MSFVRRTLEALAGLSSTRWSYAITNPELLDTVLAQQTATATREAVDHAYEASLFNVDELHLQPGLLEARSDLLADVHYLEGLLIAARARNLAPELIERLAAAVDTGHELTVHLADAARATLTDH
ncbi:hypothetical protein [Streptomyces globisporus]|uniref:hypothetical protein n=1 Tax=Streptomyces globisporus TaxID=1908 RepID=UPI002F90F8C5|nr:hypothetical protein OG449_34965 [Streptomyces globisporus]